MVGVVICIWVVSYRVKFVVSFCLFFLCWPRLNKVVILSIDDWVFIFDLFVFWMMYPTEGISGGWVMPGVVFKFFLSVSSHYMILPRVSSLVVQDLGVSPLTPKAQSVISG